MLNTKHCGRICHYMQRNLTYQVIKLSLYIYMYVHVNGIFHPQLPKMMFLELPQALLHKGSLEAARKHLQKWLLCPPLSLYQAAVPSHPYKLIFRDGWNTSHL